MPSQLLDREAFGPRDPLPKLGIRPIAGEPFPVADLEAVPEGRGDSQGTFELYRSVRRDRSPPVGNLADGLQRTRDPTGEFRLAHAAVGELSLIHISEPTRLGMISYAVF